MPADQNPNHAAPVPQEELRAAVAARGELGRELEPDVIDAFIDRVGAAIDARVDARLAQGGAATPRDVQSRGRNFTARIAVSLAIGLPLTAIAGAIGGDYGDGAGAVLGMLAALGTILGLNAYYTEVEKDLEKERLRRR
jgi:hypothetical protein